MVHIMRPDVVPVRQIAAGLREEVKADIDKRLTLEIIEPVEKATEWCSRLTITHKPDGIIRKCEI